MKIEKEEIDGAVIVSITGRIDTSGSSEVSDALKTVIESGMKKIIINFSHVEYISSSGLRVFISALKQLKGTEGSLILCELKPFVYEVFDLAGFTRIFVICDTVAEAQKT